MKEQKPIVKLGTTMEVSGHVATATGITHHGVNCVLEGSRAVTVSHEAIEKAIS